MPRPLTFRLHRPINSPFLWAGIGPPFKTRMGVFLLHPESPHTCRHSGGSWDQAQGRIGPLSSRPMFSCFPRFPRFPVVLFCRSPDSASTQLLLLTWKNKAGRSHSISNEAAMQLICKVDRKMKEITRYHNSLQFLRCKPRTSRASHGQTLRQRRCTTRPLSTLTMT